MCSRLGQISANGPGVRLLNNSSPINLIMVSGNKTPYADLHKDINSEKKALDIWTSHGTTKVIISGPAASGTAVFQKYLIEKSYFSRPFKSDLMRWCDALFSRCKCKSLSALHERMHREAYMSSTNILPVELKRKNCRR